MGVAWRRQRDRQHDQWADGFFQGMLHSLAIVGQFDLDLIESALKRDFG